jgi:uncharacterized protein YcbK (DUF882 family)
METLVPMVSPHFSLRDVSCLHCGVNGTKSELIDALERLRSLVARPIIVDDAYRCQIHNAEVGGVPDSMHVKGIAADIRIVGMTCKEMYVAANELGVFGGIGVDEHKGYIHVDLRSDQHRWCYDIHGVSCQWDYTLDS